MPGRIISMQRQARELGRLRTGYTDLSGKKPRPVRSTTWIVTSHAEHYVAAAADAWGGTVEKWQPQGGGAAQWRVVTETATLDAILPPGDPLSQAYELWSGGGCARRCDGVTETLSDSPCLCRADYGDDFHMQPKGSVCAATTRLNVFLPDMPDVGVFRCESHSYYAASEIAGAVDLIRSAVGPEAVIPIRLRIEQRQRKAAGQTKNFPVIVVELRGVTTGQVLAGAVPQLAGGMPRAIEQAAPAALPQGDEQPPQGKQPLSNDQVDTLLRQVDDADSRDMLTQMWTAIDAEFIIPASLRTRFQRAGQRVDNAPPKPPAAPAPLPHAPDALWAEIMRTVPRDWTSSQVEQDFTQITEVAVEDADEGAMRRYLAHLAELAAVSDDELRKQPAANGASR